MAFSPTTPQADFPKLEKEILDFWYESGVVGKYLVRNKASKKYFSFLDGPITANNPMGVHHGWGRTYKDLWQRYKNMQGFRQRFQNGFDCQGLWVEVEVEKELGLKSKKDIENLVPGDKKASIAKFVELCKERVKKYAAVQTEQSKRLGYFMDWNQSYYTMSDENNYMIWRFLKKCDEQGLIYKGRDSVPWCPRCGTAISEHEILTEDYKELTHEAIYLELPVVGKEREFLLVWTTTPWTIPANIAIAVEEKLVYVLVEGRSGDKFWVGKERVKMVFKDGYKSVVKTVKGKELVGLKYLGAFDDLAAVAEVARRNERFHTVVATDERILPISEAEGTGLVHVATGAGTEDFRLGKERGLPVLAVIEENGDYLPGFGFLSGKNAKDNPRIILDYLLELEKTGERFVFSIEKHKHRYPACWRCKTELVWRVVDEWYVAMDEVHGISNLKSQISKLKGGFGSPRERMKEVAKKIKWIPGFGLKRELDWLSNMHDWLVSKKRYWGLALPIWECKKCGSFEVVGGKEELRERAVAGWEKFEGHSPHRPYIDEVKIKCSCGEEMERIGDVGNPWLDAGIVPFSTISEDNRGEPLYLRDKKEWEKWFPADFITESFPGQFKNWFYSLIAQSTILDGREPMKTVLGFGTLLGEDGRPMHKSLGNAVEFNEAADKIGVDVMRWMYLRQNPANNLLFGYKLAGEVRRQFQLPLWNIYNFFITYAMADGWEAKRQKARPEDDQPLAEKVKSQNLLDRWIWARLRQTLMEVDKGLETYRADRATAAMESFVSDLSGWYVRRSRERLGPAAMSEGDKSSCYETLYGVLVEFCRMLAPFMPFMSEVMWRNLTDEESVHLSDWPELGEAEGKEVELMEEMVRVRQAVERGHAIRKQAGIKVRQPLSRLEVRAKDGMRFKELMKLIEEELNVEKVEWKEEKGLRDEVEVDLDMKVTPALAEKGKARDLVREIQQARKDLGINLAVRVVVESPWLPKDESLLAQVKQKTLAAGLRKGEKLVVKPV